MMADPQTTFDPRMAKFLADSAAFLVRQANLAATPFFEGVEIRFEAEQPPGEAALLLTARLRSGNRRLGTRRFSLVELQDTGGLPGLVEQWVQGLEV